MHFPNSDFIIDLDSPLFSIKSPGGLCHIFHHKLTHTLTRYRELSYSFIFISRTCTPSIPWHRVIKHDDFIRLLSIIHNTQTSTHTYIQRTHHIRFHIIRDATPTVYVHIICVYTLRSNSFLTHTFITFRWKLFIILFGYTTHVSPESNTYPSTPFE